MQCNEFEILIHEYNDGELPVEKEAFLFTHLAQCGVCRQSFKTFSRMQAEYGSQEIDYPVHLDTRIMATLKNRETGTAIPTAKKQVPVYYLHAAILTIITLVIFGVFQMREFSYRIEEQKDQFARMYEAVQYQGRQVNRIMDEMPAAKVRAVEGKTEVYKRQM